MEEISLRLIVLALNLRSGDLDHGLKCTSVWLWALPKNK